MAGESADDVARRQREKIERLQRSAELWERGAEGERATAAALDRLPSTEWTVFHDLRWPGRRYANVDHVVVGPPGVFVVDSKNWTGRITVKDEVLRQNGRRRENEVNGVAEAALAVAGLTSAIPPQQVFPVLCFVREEPVTGWARDVMLCSTANVLDMLVSRPRVLDAPTRRRLCLELDASSRPAGDRGRPPRRDRARRAGAARTEGVTSTSPPTPPRKRPARNRSKGIGRLVASLVAVVACLIFLASPAPRAFGDWFADRITTSGGPHGSMQQGQDVGNDAVGGEWTGTYLCSSREGAGNLVITAVPGSSSEVTAVFRFGPTRRSPDVLPGKYRMTGAVLSGVLTLRPGEWIERPPGYSPVGFTAVLDSERPGALRGKVSGCSTFSFERRPETGSGLASGPVAVAVHALVVGPVDLLGARAVGRAAVAGTHLALGRCGALGHAVLVVAVQGGAVAVRHSGVSGGRRERDDRNRECGGGDDGSNAT